MVGNKGQEAREAMRLSFAEPVIMADGVYAPSLKAWTTPVIEVSPPTFPGKTI